MNGICKLSIVPIRKSSSDQAEQISQLIFGEQVIVEQQNKNYYFIKSIHDGYRGWVDKKQVMIQSKITKADYIVNVPLLVIDQKILPFGSYLFKLELNEFDSTRFLESKEICTINKSSSRDQIDCNAQKFLHAPYIWGGKTPFGIDCSGFTQMIYRLNGVHLKRDAYQQAEMGNALSSLELSNTGDLAFFNKDNSDKITHVGIVIKSTNELKIIHASGWVQINILTNEGIIDDDGKLSHHFLFVRNILG